jgi:hypothetical protein
VVHGGWRTPSVTHTKPSRTPLVSVGWLSIDGLYDSYNRVFKISLPWEQLTHFVQTDYEIDKPEYGAYILHDRYLPRCSNLQYLRLPLGYHLTSQYQVYATPTLQALSLDFWGPEPGTIYYPQLFDKIAFPNLKNLRLEGETIDRDVPRFEIDTF